MTPELHIDGHEHSSGTSGYQATAQGGRAGGLNFNIRSLMKIHSAILKLFHACRQLE
jgi:hypothetical protein